MCGCPVLLEPAAQVVARLLQRVLVQDDVPHLKVSFRHKKNPRINFFIRNFYLLSIANLYQNKPTLKDMYLSDYENFFKTM